MLPDAPLVYPAFCNVLSPTINKWVKLTAVDVAVLRRVRGYEGESSSSSSLMGTIMILDQLTYSEIIQRQ